ncbi:4Fe-4S dicluster domain-containing protein [Gallaecimonas kandeliae]|uniref:4Fe-4S dicluster domain-containing protein n=1 Tax=Gallaecimonas kandeliae TaxID=3029055 RepID=UPI00264A2009|nr:4Fe-4S dicluster domain-containing protein [Gallaecimonas kandeliae]WKE64209.1 4Fe-4S dicluster domain-containing protein [Gallaecimonas kandeliae]
MAKAWLPRERLAALFEALKTAGFEVIGPKVKDGAIVLAPLEGPEELPSGWQEKAEAGSYRLEKTASQRCFAWNTGPQGLKPFLFKPEEVLWRAHKTADGIVFRQEQPQQSPKAFIGVRGCDLAALAIQDRHFLEGLEPDAHYQARRQGIFIVAVNCARSAATCFCVSTGDGPQASTGFDLVLDELEAGFLVEAGSPRGRAIAASLPLEKASPARFQAAEKQLQGARKQQRVMPAQAELAKLVDALDHERWQQVAERCLACGNCTSVCPTCFCSKQQSLGDIHGLEAQQQRLWDSCFSVQHSYVAGKVVRFDIKHRYRQWLVHKLATWQQQFGRSGCVGCGRCIAWCPVAIDLVEEAKAILEGGHD